MGNPNTLRSILVGLDGSAYSAAATDLGIRWGKRSGARLVGLGIANRPESCGLAMAASGPSYLRALREAEIQRASARCKVGQHLEGFARKCTQAGVPFELLEDAGVPHELIVRESQRCDLLLLGQETYFHPATRRGLADETLQKVLRNCSRPVVAVPRRPGGGQSVVVAYDGSPQAVRALQAFQATELAGSRPTEIVCINEDRKEASGQAERAAEFLRSHHIDVRVHVPVSPRRPWASSILEQVRQLNAGLLVMGASTRARLWDFLFGSMTRAVLRQSAVPVFLCN